MDYDWKASVLHTESLHLPLYPRYIFIHTVVLGNSKLREEKPAELEAVRAWGGGYLDQKAEKNVTGREASRR